MDKLSNVQIQPLDKSNYIHPIKMIYEQNGKQLQWDMLTVHDSVAIIIYNITRNVMVLVKQFRPPVYIGSIPKEDRKETIDTEKYPASLGYTIECCAGIVDKDLTLPEIAAEEVFEECGYKINAQQLQLVSTYRSGVGTSGSLQTLFYCEVTDDMKVTNGGGVEDELIEVVEMSIPEIQKFMHNALVPSPPSFMYAMQWFIAK